MGDGGERRGEERRGEGFACNVRTGRFGIDENILVIHCNYKVRGGGGRERTSCVVFFQGKRKTSYRNKYEFTKCLIYFYNLGYLYIFLLKGSLWGRTINKI